MVSKFKKKIIDGGFLVISDIHACTSDPTSADAPSYVSTQPAEMFAAVDPLDSMLETVKASGLKVSCIICPGDMTDKGEPSGIQYVWKKLLDIATKLNASLVVATPGNHDLDSRFQYNDFDARGQAMLIQPTLPIDNRQLYLEFWAEHFTIFDAEEDVRFFLLNSSAYHGGGKRPEEEREHGRVSRSTLIRLKRLLESGQYPKKVLNVMVCHHHPDAPSEIGAPDMLMEGGKALLELLNQSDVGPWMVFHGHRHRPRLFYAAGSGDGPIVLGAASFSAQINKDAQNKCPNQFHIVQFDLIGAKEIGVGIAGSVRSWNWLVGDGWHPAQSPTGLPSRAGFGFRGQADLLMENILRAIPPGSFVKWSELTSSVPQLAFILPGDMRKLIIALGKSNVRIAFGEGGIPFQVSRGGESGCVA